MLRHSLLGLWLAVGALISTAAPVQAMVRDNGKVNISQGPRVPGVLIVQFAEGVSPFGQRMQSNSTTTGIYDVDVLNIKYKVFDYFPLYPPKPLNLKSVGPRAELPIDRYHVFQLDETVDLDSAAAAYAALPEVERVEFDYVAYIMRAPNDPYYPSAFQLNQLNDHDVDAPEGWDLSVGNAQTILADTDTGVLWGHEDLHANVWVNPGEDLDSDGVVMDAGDNNGIDDDGNGYIDDLIGWDFVFSGGQVWPGEDGSAEDNDPNDFNGHGTHTSGTIAAVTNNGVGVSGLAGGFGPSEPGCRLMCLRMGWSFNDGGSENGQTYMSYVSKAFRYAADNGAQAINYSFGSSSGGGIEAATDYAVAAGVVICAAAGNESGPVTGYLQQRTDVLCVASTTSADIKSGFSNFGPEVDVSAPGSSIRSTVSNHYSPGYAIYGGTSMATPHVVGLVGLIRSLNPLLTREEVFDIIKNSADPIDGYNDPIYAGKLGTGRINAYNSVQNLASVNFQADAVIGPAPLTVQFYDSSLTPPLTWTWDFGDGDSSSVQNPIHTYAPGLYNVSLRTTTSLGDGYKSKLNFISALAETLVTDDGSAARNTSTYVDVIATNFQSLREIILPIHASNVPATASFDSLVTSGCRTSYFEYQILAVDNRPNGDACLRLRADNGGGSPALSAGTGPIARLWFTMSANANPANPVEVDTATLGSSHYQLRFSSPVVDFAPIYHPGTLNVATIRGDLDINGIIDVIDVVKIIDVAFRGGLAPIPIDRADLDCNGTCDVIDVVKDIGVAFRGDSVPTCP